MEHILNLEQVKKYYGGNSGNITKAVDGISMYVDKGEFVAIMGASGSGKTTLLNCISTIDTVTSGHITVNNQDITKIKDKDFADFRRENLGFIFQDFNLLDTLTIGENISLSLVINKQNPTDIEKRVHAIADKLGIRDILSKFPYEVSGGQKQRCACARALINEPKLILADEPTGALDSKASRLLLETMSEINKKMQATILMVTHDPFSASFCERILFLKDGKIFNEIFKGEKNRKDFFNEILDILTLLGGELGDYGKEATTKSGYKYVRYTVPAGNYTVENKAKQSAVFVVSDSNSDDVSECLKLASDGEKTRLTVKNGYHIELSMYAQILLMPEQ